MGGTLFVGRHYVGTALARGHEVTLFNRGRHGPELFPRAEKLRGDRDGDLSALQGREFDAVFDPSAYKPAQIEAVLTALGSRVGQYTFISSVSAYGTFPPGRAYDEDTPLAAGDEGYGPLKARCEEALEAALPGRAVSVRPGLIVGPHDPTDRFTYWPRRIAQGGDVAAPGRPERPVQFIDARDLAEWCVRLAEERRAGRFNAAGPAAGLTMGEFLDSCRAELGSNARLRWVPDEKLLAAGVKPWTELPLWVPEADPEHGGIMLCDNRRAIAAGLTFRPAADTIRATVDWDRAEPRPPEPSPIRVVPFAREREAEFLG